MALAVGACQDQQNESPLMSGKQYPYIDTITAMEQVVNYDTTTKLPDSFPVKYRIKHITKDSSVLLGRIPTTTYYVPNKP
jgi:hypothetical protein